MFVAILYMCLTNGNCGFVQSPPFYDKKKCEKVKAAVVKELLVDDDVTAFDAKCIHIKMSES